MPQREAPVCALVDAMFRLPAKLDGLLLKHGDMLPRGANHVIPAIKQDLENMVAILQEHDDSGADDRAMLTKEVRELSYDMEDTIDKYEHDADSILHQRKTYKITRRKGAQGRTYVIASSYTGQSSLKSTPGNVFSDSVPEGTTIRFSEKLKSRLLMAIKVNRHASASATRLSEKLKLRLQMASNITRGSGKTTRRGKTTPQFSEKLKLRLWMANKFREFSVRSEETLQRCRLFSHDVCFGSWQPTPYEELVGIDAPMELLERWLLPDYGEQKSEINDEEQKLKVVSLFGSRGVGKTTLANALYRRIGGKFDCHAFVRTSKKPDVRRILMSMLSQVRPNQPPHTWTVHSLIAGIRTSLQDKRYLIVIDDVWATSTWNIVKRALPNGNSCSGILITTEIQEVALKGCGYDSKYILEMKPLGDEHSRKLFLNTAFGPENQCPRELNEVSNNIIRKCAGLPLAVVTVASLLVSRVGKPKQWDYINKSLGYGLLTNPTCDGMKQVLNLVYNSLPQHLKACLMYLSIYQEDYIIQKDDLVKQWIAEGLICAIEENEKAEISRGCFDELIRSRMIQPTHINDNNDVLSCTVHQTVLDFVTHKSLEENFVIATDHRQTTARLANKVRRLSLHFGNAEAMPPTNMRLSQVRTLAFFGVFKCLPSILEFGLLRVLILNVWHDDESSSFDLTRISELFRLRYLHVKCNVTVEVSQAQMQRLQYLETLKIDGRVSAVPWDIVHLPGLLHLSLPVGTNMPNGIRHMTSLCTLGYFDLNVNSVENVHSLSMLTNLQDLRLTCSIDVPSYYVQNQMDSLGSIIAKLGNIRSLTLEPSSIVDVGPSSMSISCDGLRSMSSPPELLQRFEWLPHICTFSGLPKWIGYHRKLRIVKIGVMRLATKDVDVLGGFSALAILSLYVRTKPAERILFTKTAFSLLKYFEFSCSIPCLEFEAETMPKLQKLKLGFDAHRADEHGVLPLGIEHLLGLKEISAEIGGASANDGDAKVTGSVLRQAIMKHPGHPILNIQCVDGIFNGKDDDNNSRVQEEKYMTQQKQYEIKEEDSDSDDINSRVQEEEKNLQKQYEIMEEDSIMMHSTDPRSDFDIHLFGGMYSGKDDVNNRVLQEKECKTLQQKYETKKENSVEHDNDSELQEEEYETPRKQYEIKEEGSVEQLDTIPKGSTEDAQSRFPVFSKRTSDTDKQADTDSR